MSVTVDRTVLNDLTELLEDSVQYHCDDYMMSGETAWTIVSCLAEAKLAEIRGEL